MFCRLDELTQEYDFDKSAFSGVIGTEYADKAWRIPIECYGKGIDVPFEDISIVIPENSNTYLKCIFGDYMKLPPKEKQIPKHLEQ